MQQQQNHINYTTSDALQSMQKTSFIPIDEQFENNENNLKNKSVHLKNHLSKLYKYFKL